MKQSRRKVDRYLRQIQMLNEKIRHKDMQLAELKTLAMAGSGSFRYDDVRVVTSAHTETFENKVVKYTDLEREIEADRREYLETKERIINEIHSLEDQRFLQILHKKYIEGKGLFRISDEMRYSETHIRYLIGQALDAFEVIMKRGNNE